jgi:hypothetical protein
MRRHRSTEPARPPLPRAARGPGWSWPGPGTCRPSTPVKGAHRATPSLCPAQLGLDGVAALAPALAGSKTLSVLKLRQVRPTPGPLRLCVPCLPASRPFPSRPTCLRLGYVTSVPSSPCAAPSHSQPEHAPRSPHPCRCVRGVWRCVWQVGMDGPSVTTLAESLLSAEGLRDLDISFNPDIGDKGGPALLKLMGHKGLTVLRAHNCRFGVQVGCLSGAGLAGLTARLRVAFMMLCGKRPGAGRRRGGRDRGLAVPDGCVVKSGTGGGVRCA